MFLNKTSLIALSASLGALLSTSAAAGNTLSYTEYADVVNVSLVYRTIEISVPRQECWTENVREIVGYQRVGAPNVSVNEQQHGHRRNDHAAQIGGAVIGGLIGNQIGQAGGKGARTGATVVGAILGSAVGSNLGDGKEASRHRRGNPHRQPRHESVNIGSQQGQTVPIYQTRDVERCKTTQETRTEQQLQHYNVTYRFRGQTHQITMQNHPGNQIAMRLSASPAL